MSDICGRGWSILVGDVLDRLRCLPDDHFHAVVTSPPYWGLRDYMTGRWDGGDPHCEHRSPTMREGRNEDRQKLDAGGSTNRDQLLLSHNSGICGKCGAVKVDRQIGLERSVDDFIAKMVDVFREVRRVLRPDGTLWLNIGDTYSTDTKWVGKSSNIHEMEVEFPRKKERSISGMKPKEMVGVPWKLAFALSADGWYLRQEIIWSKRSPMPESVRDRCTKSHEHVFLLTKSPKYFYDFMRARSKASAGTHSRGNNTRQKESQAGVKVKKNASFNAATAGHMETANFRTVWPLSSEPYRGSHFATFPTELVRRCLLAAVSERGCCATCGLPAERIVERHRVETRPGTNSKVMKHPSDVRDDYQLKGKYHDSITGNRDPRRHITRYVTTGFKQTCECEPRPSVPCRVLDPFAGAGTTLVVARRMNCESVGIELNPDYAAMAAKRIVDDQPLFNGVAS